MKYAFIERHRRLWPIRVQCRVLKGECLGIPSTCGPAAPDCSTPAFERCRAAGAHKRSYAEHRANGWPRIWRALVNPGIRVGYDEMDNLSKPNGLRDTHSEGKVTLDTEKAA